ncbi:MAG: peptidase S10 [Terriglobia bacterium]|jgi:carboxypeptidase C (cathepsin A)
MRRTLLALTMVFLPVLILAQEPSAPPETKQTPPRKSSAQTAATPTQTPSERPQREEREAKPSTPPSQPETTQPGGPGEGIRPMHFDMTEVPPVVTHHEIRVEGKALKYTATVGRLPIKDAEDKIEAEMFFEAYTLDGADPATRPVTLAYNGGPGSASVWLHMGALGPRKVVLEPEGWLPQSPYRLEDNPNTPLDKTDLVLVDAIGTGYSRPADQSAARKFWNMSGDIAAFGEFIRIYISRYERWLSPLYLFGESYGTTRSAGLAGYLNERGINFNGIVLLSTVLNFETLESSFTNDVPYPMLLPSFTSIAWYHKKLPPDLMADPNRARQESMQFALGEYTQALASGDTLTPEQRQSVIDKLNRYTGISKEVIEWSNLRLDVGTFTHFLLADQRLRVGRLDGRFKGPDPDGFMNTRFFDPSSAETGPPFTSVFNDYVRRELNYKVDMPYYVSGQQSGFFQWSFSAPPGGRGGGNPFEMETSTPLREAIVKDRYLKILNMEGFYDLATPYLAAWYTFDHLDLSPEFRKNISHAQYESGHMVYLDSKAHAKMKQDFANFIDGTTKR